jgi:hypothetical protein
MGWSRSFARSTGTGWKKAHEPAAATLTSFTIRDSADEERRAAVSVHSAKQDIAQTVFDSKTACFVL